MAVVQLRAASEPAPKLMTLFVVRTFWLDRGQWGEGKLQQFPNMESALREGERCFAQFPAVLVQRVRGNVEVNFWDMPVTVARFGQPPPVPPGIPF